MGTRGDKTGITRWMYQVSRGLDPGWILERRTLLRFLRADRKGRLIDIACREGFKSDFFARLGFQVIGVDVDEAAVRGAKALYGEKGCQFVIASAEQLPFRATAFREAVCLYSLTMFDSPAKALAEMKRILVDDGELLLTVTSGTAPWSNMRKYDIGKLEDALRGSGFEMTAGCSFVSSAVPRWIERLRFGLTRGWFRFVKFPLFVMSWPFAMSERLEREDGYILGARARKSP